MLASTNEQVIPVDIVGSNTFGRYPKISVAQTFNMLISDEALVPYAGYKAVTMLDSSLVGGKGRALYTSIPGNFMIAVINGSVYKINTDLSFSNIGTLQTSSGTVWIAENNNREILISDNNNLYLYTYTDLGGVFSIANITGGFTIDFQPGFVWFQNSRFICVATSESGDSTSWRLSDFNNGLSWPDDAGHVGVFQTKPDAIQAALSFPGRGNVLFLFARTGVEQWTDVGAPLFPYQRSSNFNIDYGCENPATIAANENFIVWLSTNEKSGPAIMYSTGGEIKKISTDGIDFKLSDLNFPQNSFAFLFRQDGHLIYQLTFPQDNYSLIYDFATDKFFTVTDEFQNYHIARNVVFFNNTNYFVSANDNNLYEFSTNYTNYEYAADHIKEIPRIRICSPLRLKKGRNFVVNRLDITVEQGQLNPVEVQTFSQFDFQDLITEDNQFITTEDNDYIVLETPVLLGTFTNTIANMVVDLSASRDGGQNFGNNYRQQFNPTGVRRNMLTFRQLGQTNDCTLQFKFWGFSRFVVIDAQATVTQ